MNKFSLSLLTLALLASGCSKVDSMFSSEDPPLPGERISILDLQKSLSPDTNAASAEPLSMPVAWHNEFWPQAGGYPNHALQHIELSAKPLQLAWEADIGEGSTKELPLTAQPVVVDGKIYTLDTDSSLAAFDAKSGKQIWRTNARDPDEDDPVIGGGLAFSGGVLYVTNGYNELLSVRPQDGKIFWRRKIPAPSRAAPSVLDDRIFVSTLDNRLLALGARDGAVLWEHAGLSEAATLVGAASPAVSSDIVVPAFSSGEVAALRVENGSVAWTDNLSTVRAAGGIASLSDIKAMPVLDKGLVFVISFGGRLAAIDERTGTRVWQRDIGGESTPWVAGNRLFVISGDEELISLGRENGAISWITKLPRYENPEKHDDPISWTGPILAGGRLMAFSSNGLVVEADAASGKILKQWKSALPVAITPVVADGTLYILSEDGKLAAYK